MKVFDKMQRSGKIEVDKDLEEKLGFSLTAMPEHDASGVESAATRKRPTTAASKRSYAVSGRAVRPQTAGAKRRKEAFKHIANKKQTDKIVQSRNSSADSNPRSRTATKRPQSAMPSRRGRKGEKLSKTVSSSSRTRPKTAVAAKRKKASKQRMSKTTSDVADNSLEGETAHEIVEKMRQKQTMHLLQVLEEEQQSEDKREKTLRSVKDPVERRRLDKVFAVERAKASERIVRITEDNELVLADKMAQLGLIR